MCKLSPPSCCLLPRCSLFSFYSPLPRALLLPSADPCSQTAQITAKMQMRSRQRHERRPVATPRDQQGAAQDLLLPSPGLPARPLVRRCWYLLLLALQEHAYTPAAATTSTAGARRCHGRRTKRREPQLRGLPLPPLPLPLLSWELRSASTLEGVGRGRGCCSAHLQWLGSHAHTPAPACLQTDTAANQPGECSRRKCTCAARPPPASAPCAAPPAP